MATKARIVKAAAVVFAMLLLAGCYEDVSEKRTRESIEKRVKNLENDAARQ